MARQLTKEAKDVIMKDPDVYAGVCKMIGTAPASLPMTIRRNSAPLTNHDVVMFIAGSMGKTPDEILEEEKLENSLAPSVQ